MSHSHHLNHLCNLPGHRHPLWHQRTQFLYLIFQQTHRSVNFLGPKAPVCLVNYICRHNPQPPVVPSPIPASATTYLPVPNIPQQNIVHSPQTRLVPCSTAQKPPQNCNFDLNLRSFPQNKPPNVNQATNNATVFKNVQPYLPPSSANPAISHPIWQMSAQHNPNSNQAVTCSIPVNPFSTTTNIAPPFVTPVIHPTYGHTAPIPLCWGGPRHPTPPAPASENASLIKAFTDALSSKRNDPLPHYPM